MIDKISHCDIIISTTHKQRESIMLNTITKKELVASIASLPDDAELALGVDYGDRVGTTQAIGLEMDPVKAYVVESGYSSSGYKLVGESRAREELGDDVESAAVYVLNASSVDDIEDEEEGF